MKSCCGRKIETRGCREPVDESQNQILSLTGTETTERVEEDLITATDGQISCRGGRRDTSNLEKTGTVGKMEEETETAEKPERRQREEKLEKGQRKAWSRGMDHGDCELHR